MQRSTAGSTNENRERGGVGGVAVALELLLSLMKETFFLLDFPPFCFSSLTLFF